MSIFLCIVLFGVIFLLSWKLLNRKKLGKSPKGPSPLPILGNVLALGKMPHLAVKNWTEQYGKIFQMYIGSDRHIVISDLELIKKAMQHPSFQGRPKVEITEFDGASHGLVLTEGQEWQDQRRFTLRHLRDFGFGKNYMESLILEEIEELLDWIKSQGQQPISLNQKFTLAVINSLWRIITGKRFSQTDPKLEAIFEKFFLSARDVNPMLALYMPRLARMFPNHTGWNKIRNSILDNVELTKGAVNEHKAEFCQDIMDEPRDFIDAYLTEIQGTKDPQSSFYGSSGDASLAAVTLDLFQAGSITTSTTLTWALLYLALHLDVQKKLQKEIDEIVGKNRAPSLTDKPKMIYTEALTCEILRKSSLIPMGVFHAVTEDSTFEGYDMPKGTIIVPNQFYVHHDPLLWQDPDNFRPERFLTADGKLQMKEFLVPFSTGKRACLGESLARDELFLFITSLFQRFEIQPDSSRPQPTMEPVPVFDVLQAQEFFVTLKDRRD